MLNLDQAQKILDHFHQGKILSLDYSVYYYEIKTSNGIFYILQDDPLTARETEKIRSQKLKKLAGETERLLLPDYQRELHEYSSYAHVNGKYYSVYKKL